MYVCTYECMYADLKTNTVAARLWHFIRVWSLIDDREIRVDEGPCITYVV